MNCKMNSNGKKLQSKFFEPAITRYRPTREMQSTPVVNRIRHVGYVT